MIEELLKEKKKILAKEGKVFVKCRVKTNARDIKIHKRLQEEILMIHLKATPVEGKANKELIGFLSDIFEIPKSGITIKSGGSAKVKLIQLECEVKKKAKGIMDKVQVSKAKAVKKVPKVKKEVVKKVVKEKKIKVIKAKVIKRLKD